MRIAGLFAFGIAIAGSALAQPAVLMEACNAMQDPAKRLECFKAASPQARAADHDGVSRAFLGLQGSVEAGTSYNTFQASLNEVARELTIYASSAPDASKPGISKLRQALDTYSDAGTFWSAAIRFYARRDNGIAYSGGLPMQMVGLGWMVDKHGLPTRKSDIWGINAGVPTDVGRSLLMAKGRAEAADGLALLKGGLPTPAAQAAAPDITQKVIDACQKDLEDPRNSAAMNEHIKTRCDGLIEDYKRQHGRAP